MWDEGLQRALLAGALGQGYPGLREGSAYAWLERTKKVNRVGEWTAGQLLSGLRGAKHACFSAFVEAVLPNLSWEMVSKLCTSKNKEKKCKLVLSGLQPFEDQRYNN